MAAGGVGAELLADALYAIGEGGLDYYDLTPVEHRRLLAATGTRQLDPDHGMRASNPPADRAAPIRAFVEVTISQHNAGGVASGHARGGQGTHKAGRG